MKKPEDETEEDFAKVSEVNYRPVEEDETEKVLKVLSKCAAWGAMAGLAFSQTGTNDSFLFGHYVRDGGLVILADAGIGLVIGAFVGWIYTRLPRNK